MKLQSHAINGMAYTDTSGCGAPCDAQAVRGEPIVGKPEDAFRWFMGTEIETLALGNCFLRKNEQDPALRQNYEQAFERD